MKKSTLRSIEQFITQEMEPEEIEAMNLVAQGMVALKNNTREAEESLAVVSIAIVKIAKELAKRDLGAKAKKAEIEKLAGIIIHTKMSAASGRATKEDAAECRRVMLGAKSPIRLRRS